MVWGFEGGGVYRAGEEFMGGSTELLGVYGTRARGVCGVEGGGYNGVGGGGGEICGAMGLGGRGGLWGTPPPATDPCVRPSSPPPRALRKALTHLELRRAARRPNLPLKVKPGLPLRSGGALAPSAPPHPASTSEPIVLED